MVIPEQRSSSSNAPSRSYSMCCNTKPIIRQNEVNPNSTETLVRGLYKLVRAYISG